MESLVSLPPKPQEALLLSLVPQLEFRRALCNTVGRGQFALALADANKERQVICHFWDLYAKEQCVVAAGELQANLTLSCQPELPTDPVDLVALAFSGQGEGELVRDHLQQAHQALKIGGRLIATIDKPEDKFLHDELRKLFAKVSRRASDAGVTYQATKTEPLKKSKNYTCEFPFRDGDRLLRLRTRPGVFSHRSLDGGARALINAMTITPGLRVLDIGCGCGAVGLAAAARETTAQVHAIDSHSRAIEATLWAAQANDIKNLTAALDCDGRSLAAGAFDLVLANPPYFSNFRIAELFVRLAHRALRTGGEALFVTKAPKWYEERLPRWFTKIEMRPGKNYTIVAAIK